MPRRGRLECALTSSDHGLQHCDPSPAAEHGCGGDGDCPASFSGMWKDLPHCAAGGFIEIAPHQMVPVGRSRGLESAFILAGRPPQETRLSSLLTWLSSGPLARNGRCRGKYAERRVRRLAGVLQIELLRPFVVSRAASITRKWWQESTHKRLVAFSF